MIKTQILLWKTVEGSRRLTVRFRVRIKFPLFDSDLAPTDPLCNTLQTLFGQKKYEETMPDNTLTIDYSQYRKLAIFLKDKTRVYMYFKKLHIHFEDLRQ